MTLYDPNLDDHYQAAYNAICGAMRHLATKPPEEVESLLRQLEVIRQEMAVLAFPGGHR